MNCSRMEINCGTHNDAERRGPMPCSHSGLLPLSNLADLGLHQPPGSFADRLAPVAIETGIDQPFAEAVDVERIDDHAPVPKRLLQISICGTDEGALLGPVDSCIADDAVLNVGWQTPPIGVVGDH